MKSSNSFIQSINPSLPQLAPLFIICLVLVQGWSHTFTIFFDPSFSL